MSPSNHFLFTPLLPSSAVGTLEFRAIQEPVRTVPGLSYYQAKARSLDTAARRVSCRDIYKEASFDLGYDYLVLACDGVFDVMTDHVRRAAAPPALPSSAPVPHSASEI